MVEPEFLVGTTGVSVLLLVGAIFFGTRAYRNYAEFGWYNPRAFTPRAPAEPLTTSAKLSEMLPENIPDEAMVHLTTA